MHLVMEKVNFWISKAIQVAENPTQEKSLRLLHQFFETGDLEKFDNFPQPHHGIERSVAALLPAGLQAGQEAGDLADRSLSGAGD